MTPQTGLARFKRSLSAYLASKGSCSIPRTQTRSLQTRASPLHPKQCLCPPNSASPPSSPSDTPKPSLLHPWVS